MVEKKFYCHPSITYISSEIQWRIISSGSIKNNLERKEEVERRKKVKLWHIFFSFLMLPFFHFKWYFDNIGVFCLLYVIFLLLISSIFVLAEVFYRYAVLVVALAVYVLVFSTSSVILIA